MKTKKETQSTRLETRPFGWVKRDGKWVRDNPWDLHIGIPLPKKEKHHVVRPWAFGTFIRLVEWPSQKQGMYTQFYWKNKRVLTFKRLKIER